MSSHLQLAPAPAEPEVRRADRPAATELPIRVVLADDHNAMRRNLRLLLDADADVKVVAEAIDLPTASGHVRAHRPHVLVLDVHLPNASSIATIRDLRRLVPHTRIVVLTMEPSPAFAQQVLAAGASGYVLKEHADRDLLPAVRAAANDGEYVTPQVAAGLEGMGFFAEAGNLSVREVEVLRLTALGFTGAEIARRLHISERTVDSHRSRVHRKLGITTRAELVTYALRHGLMGV